jgi:hypothetical protein
MFTLGMNEGVNIPLRDKFHPWEARGEVKNGPLVSLAAGIVYRVARWFVFKPKIQIWVNFGGSCNGRCWCILRTLGPF